MLSAARDIGPKLNSFVRSAYEKPSSLFCGDYTLQSAEGVQHGDPRSPCCFARPFIQVCVACMLSSKIFTWTMKPLAAAWPICHDLQMVDSLASALGLQLNLSTSELICENLATREALLQVAPGLKW